MATTDIFLIGGGGHASVVFDCLIRKGERVIGVFDPRYKGSLGVPSLGDYSTNFDKSAKAIIAIGDNSIRKKVAAATGHAFASAVDPTATVSPSSVIGGGSMVLHGTIIQANSSLGKHVIVNTGAKIDHDCVIEDFAHIAPGVVLCGNIHVGEGALVGAGAVVIPGVKIGAWATVGAGAVVVRDVASGSKVVGNPARVVTKA